MATDTFNTESHIPPSRGEPEGVCRRAESHTPLNRWRTSCQKVKHGGQAHLRQKKTSAGRPARVNLRFYES